MPRSIEFKLAQQRFRSLTSNGRKMQVTAYNGNLFTPDGRVYVRELGGFSDGGVTIRNVPKAVPVEMGRNIYIGEGRIVLVKKDYAGREYISRNDSDDLKQAGINPRQLNANDPSTRYKTLSLMSDLMTFPTGGDGTIMVHPGVYVKSDGTYANYSGQLQIDLLTSYKPATADNQHIVAIWINEDTNAVTITTSDELSQATNLKLDIPLAMTYINQAVTSAPARRVGIGTYIVRGDDTVISEQNKFKDLRPFFQTYSLSGDSVGYPDPVDFDFVIPDGFHLLVLSDWTIETGGSVTVGAGSTVTMLDLSGGDASGKQDALSGLAITTATVAGDDKVLIQDTSDADNLKTVTAQAIANLASVTSGNIEIDVTQGETLALLDNVFENPADNEWYKIDADATAPVLCGTQRGVVVDITSAPTVTVLTQGVATGYTGLTAGPSIYAGTTAGGYTQTKPNVSDGGGQLAIVEMGYAISTTTAYIDPLPVRYAIRETLANNADMTIEHHSDAQTRTRQVSAYVASTTPGATVAEYADSNQDTDVALRYALAGDSITIATSKANFVSVGDEGGTERQAAQGFTAVNGGLFTQFTVDFRASVGTPSSTMTWAVHTDGADEPSGTILATGTFTAVASSTVTVNIASVDQVILTPALYWLVLSLPAQASNNAFRINSQASSVYAGGEFRRSDDGGATWIDPGDVDVEMTFTISAVVSKDKLAQSFEVTGSQTVESADLYLKKTGTPTGTMTLRIETDNTGEPSGTLVHANATATLAESGLGTSYADELFTFAGTFTLSGSTPYWLVLSTDRAASDTNYIEWGADGSSPGYADGEMMSEASSTWSAESKDACFTVYAEGTNYDEPLVIGRDSGGTRDVAVRFDNGAGGNPDTNTTFKNVLGVSADIVAIVEVD